MQLSPIFARPAVSPRTLPAASKPRLAGGRSQVSNIFSRLKGAGSHLVGPALTGGFAAYEISQGKDPKQVAVETGVYEGASALGAGIGGALAGPPGAIAGGILAPVAVGALGIVPEKLADISGFSVAELREAAGAPRVGGLTVPAPYESPAIPDVASQVLGGIDFSRVNTTAAAAETSGDQPARSFTAPAASRPVEESRPPVSQRVPVTATPPAGEQARKAVEEEMIVRATQQRTEELLSKLTEIGATKGMTEDNARTWISKHKNLAERLVADQAGREQRLAQEFKDFSAYG